MDYDDNGKPTDADILTKKRAIKSRMRRGGILTPLNIPEDKLQFLKEWLTSKKATPKNRHVMIRAIAGGHCCTCDGIPSHQVIYNLKGCTLKEVYCDNCLKTVYRRKPVL